MHFLFHARHESFAMTRMGGCLLINTIVITVITTGCRCNYTKTLYRCNYNTYVPDGTTVVTGGVLCWALRAVAVHTYSCFMIESRPLRRRAEPTLSHSRADAPSHAQVPKIQTRTAQHRTAPHCTSIVSACLQLGTALLPVYRR